MSFSLDHRAPSWRGALPAASRVPSHAGAALCRHGPLFGLRFVVLLFRLGGEQLLRRDAALGRFRQIEDEINDLILENRYPEIVQGIGIFSVIVEDLPLVAGMTPRFLQQRLIHLLLADLYIVVPADLGKQQPQADPPFGDAAELLAGFRIVLGRFLRLVGRLLRFVGGGRFGVRGAFERGLLRSDNRRRIDLLIARPRMRDRVMARRFGLVPGRLVFGGLLRLGRGRRAFGSTLQRGLLGRNDIGTVDRSLPRRRSLLRLVP